MAYADQQEMSKGRIVAIALVLLLHAGIGYALVTGLAYEAINKVKERLEVIDVQEDEPPEEEPPPPPPEEVIIAQPPIVTPPVRTVTNNQTTTTTTDLNTPPPPPEAPTTKTCPNGSTVAVGATCAPVDPPFRCPDGTMTTASKKASCPKVVDKSRKATPKNNASRWVTTNDYPSRSLQREEEGTTRMSLTIDARGRVSGCNASGASAALNKAACRATRRRARFNPALNKAGNPTTGSFSKAVRWQIPK